MLADIRLEGEEEVECGDRGKSFGKRGTWALAAARTEVGAALENSEKPESDK